MEPTTSIGACPRCGLCADCRSEVKEEVRRDLRIERAMAHNAYRRGTWNGAALASIAALFVALLAWIAAETFAY